MMNKLYDLVDRSNLTLIGYTYKDEGIMDQFLARLNPYKISHQENIHSHIRDIKLDVLIDAHNNTRYLLLDLNSISYGSDITTNLSRAKIIQRLCENLRAESVKFNYQIIITTLLNHLGSDSYNFNGGTAPLHSADLCFQFIGGNIKVVKNRFGCDSFDIPYKELI